MFRCEIDHLTVTAPSLALGAAYVERELGIALQPGGEHPRMGTHNLLLRLGDALFLEVIAVNPAAERPPRPRWFALDELRDDSAPRLAHWVARTGAIRSAPPEYLKVTGPIETMTRGGMQWLITIPSDGALPLDGAAPALIEWPTGVHPSAQLQDQGCTLHGFEIRTAAYEKTRALLDLLSMRSEVKVVALPQGEATRLVAHIHTPSGIRCIGA